MTSPLIERAVYSNGEIGPEKLIQYIGQTYLCRWCLAVCVFRGPHDEHRDIDHEPGCLGVAFRQAFEVLDGEDGA